MSSLMNNAFYAAGVKKGEELRFKREYAKGFAEGLIIERVREKIKIIG